ncbi:FxLD family lanthipeptide [Saccharothrix obliqua]|uniref:FxLD family lanthipeptide n=1 Tax=Saccharothrix obliqua TaxID=2861747 RepID=UPI001C5F0B22|nr:FxLD family lanthipeptide [Saccharothrix obliqua]MBW4722283.1 FxLD family lanthipeptide [Saccharothrix obliqua]
MTVVAIEPSGGATALLEVPVEDEFELDIRPVLSHQATPHSNDCPTDDGCGNTCSNGASACTSQNNNQF